MELFLVIYNIFNCSNSDKHILQETFLKNDEFYDEVRNNNILLTIKSNVV